MIEALGAKGLLMTCERAWQACVEAMNRHNAANERLAERTLLHVGSPPRRPQSLSEHELTRWLELTREVEREAGRRTAALEAYIAATGWHER